MIKTKAVIEVQAGDRVYSMECPANAPLGEAHDALTRMKGIIVGMMQTHQDQEEKEDQEEDE